MGQCSACGQTSRKNFGGVTGDAPTPKAHAQLTTMWVIKVFEVCRMRAPAHCHEELQAEGKLCPHDPSFLTIFVSHQWLSRDHPDPQGHQLQVLQNVLANIIEGITMVEVDLQAQFSGFHRTLTLAERQQLQNAYIWMDWFSVPQERNSRPSTAANSPIYSSPSLERLMTLERNGTESWSSIDEANKCIQSIPAYVEACQFFVALVPSLSDESGTNFNYSTWLQRGWCRAEMWCKMLSDASEIPIVVVTDSDRAEFDHPMLWLRSLVHEGDFGLETDRRKVSRFIQKALNLKLQRLKAQKTAQALNSYRFFAARADVFGGRARVDESIEDFLKRCSFSSINEAVKMDKGMNGLACAVLAGHTHVMQALLDARASVHATLPSGMMDVDIIKGQSLVHLAVQMGYQGEEALELLLKMRADPNNTSNQIRAPALGHCLTGKAVDLLVEHGAKVNLSSSMVVATPLDAACYRAAPPSVVQRLLEHKAYISASQGRCLEPLCMLVFHSHGNAYWKETANLLIEAQADLNARMNMAGALGFIQAFCRCWVAISSKEQPMIVKLCANGDTTPLGLAAILGSETMVDYLLEHGAKVHAKNSRKKNVLHLVSTSRVNDRLSKHVLHLRDLGRGFNRFTSEGEREYISRLATTQTPPPATAINYHDRGVMSITI
ncbi:unnamed protein product [Durusdinium trenchii]|uniref:Uncharacterized protein n=2 Tax=Durusdinium trenchii TaxID=1381693 RepID=A0ABP0LXP8_9DINO